MPGGLSRRCTGSPQAGRWQSDGYLGPAPPAASGPRHVPALTWRRAGEAGLDGVRPWSGPAHRPPTPSAPPCRARARSRTGRFTHAKWRPRWMWTLPVEPTAAPARSASKWRKWDPAGALLRLLPEGRGGWGRPDAGERDGEGGNFPLPSRAGRPVPHRSGRKGEARPVGYPGVRLSQWLGRAVARAAGAGQSAGAAGGAGSRSGGAGGAVPVGTCPGRDVPRSGLRRSLPSDAAAPTGLGYSVPRASGQLGPASSAGVLPPPHHPRPLWPNRLGCPMCCAKCFLRMSVADFFSPSYLNRAITTC